jgi:hypothetical protein
LQNRVAQKLQSLIIKVSSMRLVPKTGVSQCLGQEQRIAKLVADAFFERIHPTGILT